MRLKESLLLRDLDKTLAIAGAIFSLILIAYLGREFGRAIYLLIGVLALISCLLWLAIRRSHTLEFHLFESRTLTVFCATCFFGLYTLSVLSVHFRPELYERPLLYFALTALMAGVIAYEIFASGRQHTSLILIQILLLGISIAWSQLLLFPSLLGVDPWYHSAFTSRIIEESVIPDGYPYSKLPLFHLMIAGTSLTASLPYKFAAMVSVSLVQIICNTIFVFLIGNYLFKNRQIGLLAALLVIIANHHISMSYWSIPNAFAAIFISVALYLLFPRFKERSYSTSAILYTMALAPIILTHTITAVCMAILLFVTWGTLAFYHLFNATEHRISLIIPISFTLAMLAWWTYASDTIGVLTDLIRSEFSIDFFVKTPEDLRGYGAFIPLGEQLFNNLGMFLFFAFSFIGIFYMISRKGSYLTSAMAWIAVVPLVVGFFPLISRHTLIEERWWYFAQILLSIPLAVAIFTVETWKTKNRNALHLFAPLFVVVLTFLMILSPPANADNLLFSPNSHIRYSPTVAELESVTTLIAKWDGPIKTDEYLAGSRRFQYPQISAFCKEIYSHDYVALKNQVVLIRKDTVGKPFKFFSSIYKLDYDLNMKLNEQGFSQIYDSNSVNGYRG
ncbi:hypothetical protein HL657_07550 [Methanoculleus sp. YWC-01]|uniref:Glycosyltransferase RgtA/B/C/D-like domain-containing protein n=1 Tax=Methanoculleus nereidis TaxID=2735141 RepID=A0ABU3Z2L6_9EURY|nr:hypothetical protein [Methanoculleus sp. YWC-01]MDV4343031.1 hypothetical protein [Methanoculleus sp. YWC-01]